MTKEQAATLLASATSDEECAVRRWWNTISPYGSNLPAAPFEDLWPNERAEILFIFRTARGMSINGQEEVKK